MVMFRFPLPSQRNLTDLINPRPYPPFGQQGQFTFFNWLFVLRLASYGRIVSKEIRYIGSLRAGVTQLDVDSVKQGCPGFEGPVL